MTKLLGRRKERVAEIFAGDSANQEAPCTSTGPFSATVLVRTTLYFGSKERKEERERGREGEREREEGHRKKELLCAMEKDKKERDSQCVRLSVC